ncbi:VOC family protein [Glaciimonas sp. GG7]
MPAIALNHYNLRAPRELMEQLKTFYCEMVGLKQGERPPFNSFGYWLYAGEHPVLHLSETRPGQLLDISPMTTFDHAAFSCVNQAEMEARLATHEVQYKLVQVPLTGQTQIFFKDPAGNGVELNFA